MTSKPRSEAEVHVVGSISRLAEDVTSSVRRDVEAKIDEAFNAAKKLLDEAFQRLQDKVREEIQGRLRAAQEQLESYRAAKEVELRKKIVQIKSKYAESVLQEVLSRLRSEVTEEEYRKFMEAVLRSALERASKYARDIVVVPAEPDRAVVEEALKRVGEVPVSVQVSSESAKGLGGFVVKSADGRLSLDYRLEALLQSLIEEVKTVVLRVLFPS